MRTLSNRFGLMDLGRGGKLGLFLIFNLLCSLLTIVVETLKLHLVRKSLCVARETLGSAVSN